MNSKLALSLVVITFILCLVVMIQGSIFRTASIYDDFNDGSLSTSLWKEDPWGSADGSSTEEDGFLKIEGGTWIDILTNATFKSLGFNVTITVNRTDGSANEFFFKNATSGIIGDSGFQISPDGTTSTKITNNDTNFTITKKNETAVYIYINDKNFANRSVGANWGDINDSRIYIRVNPGVVWLNEIWFANESALQNPNIEVVENRTIPDPANIGDINSFFNLTFFDTNLDNCLDVQFGLSSPNNSYIFNADSGNYKHGAIESNQNETWHSNLFNITNWSSHIGTWAGNYTIITNYTGTDANFTGTIEFAITDPLAPQLSMITPTNNSIYQTNISVLVNLTYTENLYDGNNTLWFSFDSGITNITISNWDSYEYEYLNGSYNFTIWANDTSNNLNTTILYNVTILRDITNPNLTILSPSGASSDFNIDILINATDNAETSYCFYNITRGASLEVANTEINCLNGNATETMSAYGSYVLWVFANDSVNNINVSNSAFSLSATASPSGGGGGGSWSEPILREEVEESICIPFRIKFYDIWEIAKQEEDIFEKIKLIWNAFWDYILCQSASSIIPI